MSEVTTAAGRALCRWCGVRLRWATDTWTEDDDYGLGEPYGTGDYCPEGRLVGSDGLSPHYAILADTAPSENGSGLVTGEAATPPTLEDE